jgi:hypothetical protein
MIFIVQTLYYLKPIKMKTILEALELIKEIEVYDKNIIIALGVNKLALSVKEGFYVKKLEDERSKL